MNLTRTSSSTVLFACMLLLLGSCHPKSCIIEPCITYCPSESLIQKLPGCFPDLTPREKQSDWGKELMMGEEFAKEADLYRAITCFKRAFLLIPKRETDRRNQILYDIMFAYYLGGRLEEAVAVFEENTLAALPPCFPAYREMTLMMYDCYSQLEQYEKADSILNYIEKHEPEAKEDLVLETAILEGNLGEVEFLAANHRNSCEVSGWLEDYHRDALSVRKAQTLNALLPGAGYYYAGQKQAALTSLIINALFSWASYEFFHHGYIAAGLITASLEWGWYMGGINGAGLAAKEYNESLYNQYAKEAMIQYKLFPILMFECAF